MNKAAIGIVEKLLSSAEAFRENSVFTSDGDEVRLGVQADECAEAAAIIMEMVEALEETKRRVHRARTAASPADAMVEVDAIDDLSVTLITKVRGK